MKKPTYTSDKKTNLPATGKPKTGEWIPGGNDTVKGNWLDKLDGAQLVDLAGHGVKAFAAHNELHIAKEQTEQKKSEERVALKQYDVEDKKSELEHNEEMQKLCNQDKQGERDHAATMEHLSQQGKALNAKIEKETRLLDNLLADKTLSVDDYVNIVSQE